MEDVAISIISQEVVPNTPCMSVFVVPEVVTEQVSEAIVVPNFPAPKRGWYQWCDGAALAVGNLIVNGIRYF
jgi:hypothetical protein